MAPLQARAETYRFGLDLLLPDGRRLQQLPLEKEDFSRAIEATFFDGLRRGVFPEYRFSLDEAWIVPRFAAEARVAAESRPELEGFEVVLAGPGGEQRKRF